MKSKIDEAQLEKTIDEISGLIAKAKAAQQKVQELREEIRKEVLRDNAWWNFDATVEDNVEYHRQMFRGHGDAQYLYTKLPPLIKEAEKLNDEVAIAIAGIAK